MIDVANRFMVGSSGKSVVVLVPLPQRFTADEALNLAAYLVCCAEVTGDTKFGEVLAEVQGMSLTNVHDNGPAGASTPAGP